MDLCSFSQIHFNWEFILGALSIIVIDLVLAGDNAVIIAMAVRTLPRRERKRGIFYGAGAAVALRVVFTFFAAQLLQIQFVKFAGGAFIIWIALKLFVKGAPGEEIRKEVQTFWQAVWIIVVADITMSADNILAIAAASKGNLFLLVFGLGLSIPFIVFTSNILSMLMDKYPVIIYIGAAILGRVGGEMIISDPFIVNLFHPSRIVQYGVELFFTVGVIVVGTLQVRMKQETRKKNPQHAFRKQCKSKDDH
ncbi:MAG: TerC family protein [Syntrophales bacterium]